MAMIAFVWMFELFVLRGGRHAKTLLWHLNHLVKLSLPNICIVCHRACLDVWHNLSKSAASLPPANEVLIFYTCLSFCSQGGRAWPGGAWLAGVCVVGHMHGQGGMCGQGGGCAWWGACMARGVHGRGACMARGMWGGAWWRGACIVKGGHVWWKGGMHGKGGVCMVKGGHVWWRGACVAKGGRRVWYACPLWDTAGQCAGGTHPTGMHSCWMVKMVVWELIFESRKLYSI